MAASTIASAQFDTGLDIFDGRYNISFWHRARPRIGGNPGLANPATTAPPLAVKWHKLAEARCAEAGERLTPARLAAYAELLAIDKPVSAYELIALLEDRQQRKIAPLTVYRHLDFLIRVGLVHRLESTQSYLPCDRPEHTHVSQYLLCSSCGRAVEVESNPLDSLLRNIAEQNEFRPEKTVVEIRGLCERCADSETD
jgi:Fur family zinc uptake transcriptional regulator